MVAKRSAERNRAVRMADVGLIEPPDPSAAPLEQRRRRRGTAWLWSAALVGAAAVVIVTSGRLGLTTRPDVPDGATDTASMLPVPEGEGGSSNVPPTIPPSTLAGDYVLAQDYVLALESVGEGDHVIVLFGRASDPAASRG
ncbi:hypothetical protein ASG23_02645 [Cellulomonas sp. Leaf395]|nr:hypothetical protein ASG23_02645 [Cellulomonas sp. Leaf395]